MKIHEIISESPFRNDTNKPSATYLGRIETTRLRREYVPLGNIIDKEQQLHHGWLHRNKTVAIVCPTTSEDDCFVVETKLEFQPMITLVIPNGLHEKEVNTIRDLQRFGLSKQLYLLIVSLGYTIMSDFTHHNGGRELWNSLLRDEFDRGYVIRVWEEEMKDYY